ncbi:MAG TPA: FecR domain-containing protein [Steroidobacteraceae bacterium]|jgi:transmembrane sensor|nr:FecR domain-containing protein [Steroidobacteraceae bacterium]
MRAPPEDLKAADWFARSREAVQDPADEAPWLEWIQDTGHQQAYENCELAWELSAELRGSPTLTVLLAGADALVSRQRAPAAPAARPRWRVPVWQVGLAASLLALGAFAWLYLSGPMITEYSTAVGEQRTVALADGSTVFINTDSQVRVALSRNLRRVELSRGEALFSVSHDPGRPFEVHALQGVTTAVGTQFDVELTRGGAAVSVLEGTVTVGASGTATPALPVAVSAGSGVGYTQAGAVSELRPAEVNRIQGWRSQRIVFNDIALDTALAEYNRYTRTPIVLSDPALGSRHINGVFHIGDEAAFLSAMEQGLHLKATRATTQTVLEPEAGYTP